MLSVPHRAQLGIITVDDVLDIAEQRATEDIQKLGGSEALGASYLDVRFTTLLRKRGGWLAALFLGEMLTATAMGYFEAEIARAVVLALFVAADHSAAGAIPARSHVVDHPRPRTARAAAARLVEGVRPRNRRRPGPGRVSGRHRLLPDRAVAAPALRRLRPTLPAGGVSRCAGP